VAYSVWPDDILNGRTTEFGHEPNRPRCFVVIPSRPKVVFDDIFEVIQSACNSITDSLGFVAFDVRRAVDTVSAGVVHWEICQEIKEADVVIADLTGHNPNVMFELGVAAAHLDKDRVIFLVEDQDVHNEFPFDVMPARHIVYQRTRTGFEKLFQELAQAILGSLSKVPLTEIPEGSYLQLPFCAALDSGVDDPRVWTRDLAHRRILSDCLEFGSFFLFPYSGASVANLKIDDVHVKAEMKLTEFGSLEQREEWIGIAVRSQHYFANYGWLVPVDWHGYVKLAYPKSDLGVFETLVLGQVRPLSEPGPARFVAFDVTATSTTLSITVDDFHHEVRLTDLPFVPTRGRVLFQAAFCRAGLRRVLVERSQPRL
jgi:hypothetical protein